MSPAWAIKPGRHCRARQRLRGFVRRSSPSAGRLGPAGWKTRKRPSSSGGWFDGERGFAAGLVAARGDIDFCPLQGPGQLHRAGHADVKWLD